MDDEEEWVPPPAAPPPKKEESKKEPHPKKEEHLKKKKPAASPRPVKQEAPENAKPAVAVLKVEEAEGALRVQNAPKAVREVVAGAEEEDTSAAKRARIADFQRKVSALHREWH